MDMSVYLNTPLQLDKICRACLSERGDMRPLFGACLDEMLNSFAGIEVAVGDGLPDRLCLQCVLQCSRAYTFKQLCEKSDNILRQYLSPEFQTQLSEALESTLQVKSELQEQLQFPDNIANVVIEEETADFVTYNEDDPLGEKEGLYTIQEVSVQHEVFSESESPADTAKSKYPCSKCDKSFDLKVDLKVHMLSHPKDLDFVCEICNKAFAEARILKRHAKIHMETKPHQCDQCHMSFAESSNLSKHKKKHTGELRNIKGKPHLCSVCGRSFKWSSSLSKHMKYHTGHKLLACEFCGKQYVEARSLTIHIRSHTGERPYECEVCHKTFTQVCNLEKHIRVHTGEKPFECPICNKRFTQSGYVGIHMRSHTGVKPYVCQVCGKAFAGSSTLTIHQQTHTGKKPYDCTVCKKSFSRHETLVIHTRTHTGEKPHVCKVCSKAFTSSGLLSGHMRTHTGIKPYECAICSKKNRTRIIRTNLRDMMNPFEIPEQHFKQMFRLGKIGLEMLISELQPYIPHRGTIPLHLKSPVGSNGWIVLSQKPKETKDSQRFASSSSLRIHVKSHNDKAYTCKICNKSFPHSSNLDQHILTHTIDVKEENIKIENIQVTEILTVDNQRIKVQAITL